MDRGHDVMVWERYATELALAFGAGPARIEAVRVAYLVHGFDIDLICDISGFPAWRIRQAIDDAAPRAME
jgi:hypothetical protein